jgi:hypothetical protein
MSIQSAEKLIKSRLGLRQLLEDPELAPHRAVGRDSGSDRLPARLGLTT